MKHLKVNEKVINRLARVEGQVRSIRKMVASGRDCSDVMIQIAAARAALGQTWRVVLEDHLEHCITEALQEDKGHDAIGDLKAALKHFVR